MKKIPTLFLRDTVNPLMVTRKISPVCEWVARDEGLAYRKWDGQPILLQDGLMYKRYTGDLKEYSGNPLAAISCGEDGDGTPIWWVLVTYCNGDRHILAAMETQRLWGKDNNGTYEIVGPNFCHNRESRDKDVLMKHVSHDIFPRAPANFLELVEWIRKLDIEGLVWHHPDGRMAKIKKCDLGLSRKPRSNVLMSDTCLGAGEERTSAVAKESDLQVKNQSSYFAKKLGTVGGYEIGGEG